MSHSGKVVVVTGAAGGMGKEIVLTLLSEGATVVGLDLHLQELELIEHPHLLKKELDLLNEKSIKEVFQVVFEKFGKIDGLVNVAGIAQQATPIENVTLDDWNKLIGINATAIFLTCKEAVQYMKKQSNGAIVNVGSVSVTRPRPGLQSYIASKGAMEAFTRALAIEAAASNIRVNVLHPGPAETAMLPKFTADNGGLNLDVFKQSVPLGQLIQPSDIAAAVSYLLSDGAKMVTGSILHVDGGRSL